MAQGSNGEDKYDLKCITFNCRSFKQSSEYIADLLSTCDILCLSETWLRPGELDGIHTWLKTHPKLCHADFRVFAKSSMEENSGYCAGRPYGGLATIVRKHALFTANDDVDVSSDRVLAVGLYDTRGKMAQVICNVYLPFYDPGDSYNTEHYVDTVAVMQSVIDNCASECSVKFLGDTNVQLPRNDPKFESWYKSQGFNKNSKILYDFMRENNFKSADLMFMQPCDGVKYTYFCYKRNVFTWLDHVLCAYHDLECVKDCNILGPCADNVSDHLPVSMTFSVHVPPSTNDNINSDPTCHEYRSTTDFPPQISITWDSDVKSRYNVLLKEKLLHIEPLNVCDSDSLEEAQVKVDNHVLSVCNAISAASKAAKGNTSRQFKPKRYWCPALSELRNRKRFWWKVWHDCGRPRQGSVYNVYKDVKRRFRRLCRERTNLIMHGNFSKLNELYYAGRLCAFWSYVKKSRRSPVSSKLHVDALATHFKNVMTDSGTLTNEQNRIASQVDSWYSEHSSQTNTVGNVSKECIHNLIIKLNSSCAPGIDNITSEHLKYGNSDALCSVLSNLYTVIFTRQIVPSSFKTGVIVPIYKKPGLDTNQTDSYRPVTLSTTFSKMLEMLMIPADLASDNQFGFRKCMGTTFACSLYNDVTMYFKHKKSPLYSCTLDAEKCFDSIWHKALFYKLHGKIPNRHWILLYRWYNGLRVAVKWKGAFSGYFNVTKGTRQGSILSPHLFNIFINDLLLDLKRSDDKVCIGSCSVNSFAYADDVNLLCTTVPGLQRLIDICTNYADKWRFRFGIKKTKCMVSSGKILCKEPVWYLKGERIDNVDYLEILGVAFGNNGEMHVHKRIEKCRRAYYSLRGAGLAYPGCSSDVKSYIWNTICQPVLLYGLDSISISSKFLKQLETVQGNLVKQSLGISKRARSSYLLEAMKITSVKDCIKKATASLLYRLFAVESPGKKLTTHLLSSFIARGTLIPGTIVHRLISFGLSPTKCAFSNVYHGNNFNRSSGVVDSLRYLLLHENFIKPYSEEHVLAALLTKSF